MSSGRRHGPSRSMMLVMVTSPILSVCMLLASQEEPLSQFMLDVGHCFRHGDAVAECRRSSRLRLVYGFDAIQNLAEIALRDLNVIIVLQVEPKLRRCAERLGESKRRVGGNAGLLTGDPLDPRARQAA